MTESLPLLALELLALGAVIGFLAGLLGIGGGMLMVPFVSFILGRKGFDGDYAVKAAVATSLATICFTSISSVLAHRRRDAVAWPVVKGLAPGIVLGALLGAQVAAALPGRLLGYLFAVFVAFSATQMFIDRKPKPSRALPGTAGLVAVGTGIGALSALVGAGGAFMSVPFMTWCNMKIHDAVGTSSALGFPIAFAGTAGYIWAGRDMAALPHGAWGYLYLPALLFISLASMSTAPFGARTAHGMDIRPLKRIFACVLYVLALYFVLR